MVDPDLGGDPDEFTPAAVAPSTRREFLLQAALLNFGLLMAGAGLILVLFTTELATGGIFFGLGTLALLVTGIRYVLKSP